MSHRMQASSRKITGLLLLTLLLLGCPSEPPQKAPETGALVRVSAEELPGFADDLDGDSLRTAVQQSLTFYSRVPPDRTYRLGELQIRVDLLQATLVEFLALLDSGRLTAEAIFQTFDVYRYQPEESETELLLTGYYEPILEGRLMPDDEYRYPLYSAPPDLLTVDLAAFDPELYAGKTLRGRLSGDRVVPYFTREQIDGQDKLSDHSCELIWLRDPLDVFFLQIQGSGMIRLPQEEYFRVGYAASNGRPYRSIGKYLLDKGLMQREEITLQSIRAYLQTHPEMHHEVLWHNESYVFFRRVEQGPVGSLNVPLTAGRSIASDPECYPRGGIAFLQSQKPRLDADGQVIHWEPLHRWVVNQDTGGAIKGFKRADLFCGSGEPAEHVAGRLKHAGKLYFFIKKQS
jgi:membrane-bound lytic murein transglycosylase A